MRPNHSATPLAAGAGGKGKRVQQQSTNSKRALEAWQAAWRLAPLCLSAAARAMGEASKGTGPCNVPPSSLSCAQSCCQITTSLLRMCQQGEAGWALVAGAQRVATHLVFLASLTSQLTVAELAVSVWGNLLEGLLHLHQLLQKAEGNSPLNTEAAGLLERLEGQLLAGLR